MKKFLTYISLLLILVLCLTAGARMARMPRSYDGRQAMVPVEELQKDPSSYDDKRADGAAAVIVQQNLEKSHAVNDVTSIVFDFRGYDTMGEAFILITAVAGSAVILFSKRKEDGEDGK